jgi:beta-galactosidase
MTRAVALLLLLLAAACARPGAITPPAPAASSERIVTGLESGWRFLDGAAPDAAAQAGFDDSGWPQVTLPHTWNTLGEYRVGRTQKTRNRMGVGWYRLALDAALLPARERHYLQFDGVGSVADVWVNGRHVGRHAGAFSRFRLDVTDALRRDGPNLIAVRADNSAPEAGSTTLDVIPINGDFFIHGGLYRPVSLVSVGEAHVDLLDHGGPGVYVDARAEDGKAALRIRTRLRAPAALEVETVIRSADGEEAGRVNSVAAPGSTEVEQQLTLLNPRLWDGRRDPHLYTATVELKDGGRLLDRVEQRFGVRSIRFDAREGFFLNGRYLPLHGVSRHQDWFERGWALTRADHAQDMALIAEMGANTVRFAHYQHAEDWFELSDEAGMIVWAEAPYVGRPSMDDTPGTPALTANAREQMTELIRQNYNHPSVITWGTGNEVDIVRSFGGSRADGRPLLDELRRVATAEDPGRPTVYADCCESTPARKPADMPALTGHTDLMGYNRYFGWYYGTPADLGPHLDLLHARYPAIPISVSEYGAGAALSQHTDNPEGGPMNTGGRWHPEEYQSWIHEQSWPQLAERRFVWASWIWNMFDFASVIRNEGDATDINDKGLVTFDRAVKKDAFFFYKANWSEEPVLHIAGRRYADRAYPVTDVRIYSNRPEVRLWVNGIDKGTAPCPGRVCVFRRVALDPGANQVRATAGELSDSVAWNAPDAAAGLSINVGDLAGFVRADGSRVGSDNWFEGGTPHRIGGKAAEALAGAGDPRMRAGYREGALRYAIPLPDGRWQVTLLFVAPDTEARTFDVAAEGRTVLRRFDPAKAAGGTLKGVERSFAVTVADGKLDLAFSGDAVLSGIRITPQ